MVLTFFRVVALSFTSEEGNCGTNVAPMLSSQWFDIFRLCLEKKRKEKKPTAH